MFVPQSWPPLHPAVSVSCWHPNEGKDVPKCNCKVQKSSNINVRYTASVSHCPHTFPPAQSFKRSCSHLVDCMWSVMAHAQKPDFVFRWNRGVHLSQWGRQFSQLLAAEVCTKFRGSVNGTGYSLNSPVSPSLPLLCVTVCHHVSNAVYQPQTWLRKQWRWTEDPSTAVCNAIHFSIRTSSILSYVFLRPPTVYVLTR